MTAEPIEPYDTELPLIYEVHQRLQSKYTGQSDSLPNIMSFTREAVDAFAKIGFHIQVNPLTSEITLVSRIKQEEFDHERQAWEVQKEKVDEEKVLAFKRSMEEASGNQPVMVEEIDSDSTEQ